MDRCRATFLFLFISIFGPLASGHLGRVDAAGAVAVALGLDRPMWVASPPDDFEHLFIVEHKGVIKVLNLLSGEIHADLFLDIQNAVEFNVERGLQSIAFHPQYSQNGYFFLKYHDLDGHTVISRFSVDPSDPLKADTTSEVQVLFIEQPAADFHKGGNLAFGPLDGYLYIPMGIGDGGGNGNAQNPQKLLGKILRIDVDELPYSIPDDNPFTAANDPLDEVLDEIWAFGVRQPFRIGFDALTGDLYFGDVGAQDREEISFQPGDSRGGENYGWRCLEGDLCTGLGGCDCLDLDLVAPILSYNHADFGNLACVIGGTVYRGDAIPSLQGTYLYANFTSDQVFSFVYDGNSLTNWTDRTDELGRINNPVAFCEDSYGELYVVARINATSSHVYKIIPDNIEDLDCNGNLIVDTAEIAAGVTLDADGNNVPDECVIRFIRGDCDGNGSFQGLVDALFALSYQFSMGPEPTCLEACDADGDANFNGLVDGVYILGCQFVLGNPCPPQPYPDCAADPDPLTSLGCSPNACP